MKMKAILDKVNTKGSQYKSISRVVLLNGSKGGLVNNNPIDKIRVNTNTPKCFDKSEIVNNKIAIQITTSWRLKTLLLIQRSSD